MGGTAERKLLVYQSTWAMERRRPDGVEWPLDRQLEMIRDAGFDGVAMDVQADLDYARTVDEFLRAHGMSCMSETYPDTLDQLMMVIEGVAELKATDHINVLPGPAPTRSPSASPSSRACAAWPRTRACRSTSRPTATS